MADMVGLGDESALLSSHRPGRVGTVLAWLTWVALLAFAVTIFPMVLLVLAMSSDGCVGQGSADSWSVCSTTGQNLAVWIPVYATGIGVLAGLIGLATRRRWTGVYVAWLLTASGVVAGLLIASHR
jgi:hypothetical protein